MDKRERYHYTLSYNEKHPKGCYYIHDSENKNYGKCEDTEDLMESFGHVVAVVPMTPEMERDLLYPPKAFRDVYEKIIEYDPQWEGPNAQANLVEMLHDATSFNQACRFGNLCEEHAVYCHNTKWLYAPRKCRRTWYTGGAERDEDCEGFAPNMHAVNAVPT